MANPDTAVPLVLQGRHKNGTWRTLSSVGTSHLDNPAIRGLIVNFHDITDQRRVEQELRDAKQIAEQLARTDPLTGVANRRAFFEDGDEEFSRARRFGHPLSVLMMDIDHFKHINDTYGHAGGDEVLKYFALFLRQSLRDLDRAGRLGGEEFAVLLIETSFAEAMDTAERIRIGVAGASVEYESQQISFTTSLGVAHMTDQDVGLSEMLARADAALYRAKHAGRNRVECGQA